MPVIAIMVAMGLVLAGMAFRDRTSKTTRTRIDLIPDMDAQPKFKAQSPNALFQDGRSMRQPVDGTVARGEAMEDRHLYYGLDDNEQWAVAFPFPVTMETMKRGQDRYNIYCVPCHGFSGNGDGMVAKRADELAEGTWTPPPTYHSDRMRQMPVGQIFQVITYGIRNMPAYGPQIPPEDRWTIIAYLRALQRSGNATLDDVPGKYREALK